MGGWLLIVRGWGGGVNGCEHTRLHTMTCLKCQSPHPTFYFFFFLALAPFVLNITV